MEPTGRSGSRPLKTSFTLGGPAIDAITDLRRIIYWLRPPALDDLGPAGSLREQIGRPRCQEPVLAISLGVPSTGLADPSVAAQMAMVLYVGGPSRTLVRG